MTKQVIGIKLDRVTGQIFELTNHYNVCWGKRLI